MTTAVVTYTSVQPASTSYLTATTTFQQTTTQVSTQLASTQTVTQYTTLTPSTVTSTLYSTVQTTNVVTQTNTIPASSIYVTYTVRRYFPSPLLIVCTVKRFGGLKVTLIAEISCTTAYRLSRSGAYWMHLLTMCTLQTTVQGQVSTVTVTYTPSTSTARSVS